jgi:uncharacterized membrane-anchored protein YjiN (DUF445 family)
MERTVHQPVSAKRRIFAPKRPKSQDPRFNPLIGEFNPTQFAQTYSFLDELKKKENKDARRQLRKMKKKSSSNPYEMDRLKNLISKNKGDLKKSKNTQRYMKARLEVKKRAQKEGQKMTSSKRFK